MSKREPNGARGYPLSWDAQPVGKPSQAAYNAAMSYIESHPVTPVDLHQEHTEGKAYEALTDVSGTQQETGVLESTSVS